MSDKLSIGACHSPASQTRSKDQEISTKSRMGRAMVYKNSTENDSDDLVLRMPDGATGFYTGPNGQG